MKIDKHVALQGIDRKEILVESSLLERFWNWLLGKNKSGLPEPEIRNGHRGYSAEGVMQVLSKDPRFSCSLSTVEAQRLNSQQDELLRKATEAMVRREYDRIHRWDPERFGGSLVRRSMVPSIGTPRQKKRPVNGILAKIAATAIVGTGALIGSALPDWDIAMLGIGGHRNFLFHSAAPLYGAYRLHVWLVNKFPATDKPLRELCYQALGLFIGGVALGAATHLFIDATVQGTKAVLFPLIGSLVNGTLVDDNLFLGLGSLWSLYIAFKEFEYSLGRDHWLIKMVLSYLEKIGSAAETAWAALKKVVELLSLGISKMEAFLEDRFAERRFLVSAG